MNVIFLCILWHKKEKYGRDVIELCVENVINDGVEAQQGNLRLFFRLFKS